MKFKILLFLLFSICASGAMQGQGYYFGVKGGMTLGVQKWNSFERDPLIKYHGIAFIESLDDTGQFSLFAQAGFHQKGSAIRNRNFFDRNGNLFRPSYEFIFNNISLTVGGKKKHWLSDKMRAHYMFGLRGDYTIGTNLDEYEAFNERNGGLFFPVDFFVRKLNFGLMFGGGLEFDLSEFVGAVIDFTVNPDVSYQYKQPEIRNVYNPLTMGNRTIQERTIRNLTFQISVGFRFLRKIEYID
ncbi:MAG TPA: hypothetical protein ENJ95_24795 [Bacteroidetes bacterium]|nr:hypothetical protein [Bacteroidota bacterium]